jgi:hypothetical protein
MESMGKVFEFSFGEDPAKWLHRFKANASGKEITVWGDAKAGWLSGGESGVGFSVEGTYKIVEGKIMISIKSKSALYSWEQIGSVLKDLVEG